MFLEYFRFREQPFGVTPDPRYLFPSPGHREALASLLYGIETNLGFGTLIAHPGMGKTTLLFHILEQYRRSARTAFIFNTQCNSFDLLRSFLSELEEDSSSRDTFQLHEKFKQVLANEAEKRRRVILVIDEAQNLGDMVMETVRLLSNFESAHAKLLHIILAGQPELAAKLSRPELSQLQQRIPMLTHLPSLMPQDIAAYIEHRLRVAGYQGPSLFTAEAVRHVVWLSRGVPREINRLCFNSLSLAYASSKPFVDLTVVEEVATDLGLTERLQQEKRDQAYQYEAIAVNAGAARAQPAQPVTPQIWPRTSSRGPQPVEAHRQQAGRSAAPITHQAAPAGPVRVAMPPREPLPPIQRVRRASRESIWESYKRPLGYAFFCLTLIAAGWAAVNRWAHPYPSAADAQSAPDAVTQSTPDPAAPTKVPGSSNGSIDPAKSPSATDRVPKNTKLDTQTPVESNGSAGRRTRRHSSNASSELLASARTAPDQARPEPSLPPVPAYQGPPVRVPTVADQGQMEFVKYVRPHYPEEARARHIEGTVVLSAVVARDGTVKGVKPVSGDPTLLKAAELAVRDWVYRPYQIDGRPVDVDTEIVINFALPKRLNP